MTTDTRTDYARNIRPALQELGYNLRDIDLDALAADLHDSVEDPAVDGPAAALRQLGMADVIRQYIGTRAYRIRVPRHGVDIHRNYVPEVDGGDELAGRSSFTLANWMAAVGVLAATARGLDLDPDSIDVPQVLADLLNGTDAAIPVNDKTPRMLAGRHGFDGLHAALAGDAAPGSEGAQDVDDTLDLTGAWF